MPPPWSVPRAGAAPPTGTKSWRTRLRHTVALAPTSPSASPRTRDVQGGGWRRTSGETRTPPVHEGWMHRSSSSFDVCKIVLEEVGRSFSACCAGEGPCCRDESSK